MENEIWLEIPNFNNYEINNKGNVRHLSSKKIVKQYAYETGYNSCSIFNNNGKRYKINTHILMAITFLNHIPCGHKKEINHKDKDKHNNNIENLEVVTHAENMRHHFNIKNNGISNCIYFNKKDNKYNIIIYIKKLIHVSQKVYYNDAKIFSDIVIKNISLFENAKQFRELCNSEYNKCLPPPQNVTYVTNQQHFQK